MRKFFTLMAVALAVSVSTQAQTTIYAYRTWQYSNPLNCRTGPVKFQSDNPKDVELIADQTKLGHVNAGTYFNYKWYGQVTKPGTQSQLEGFYTIDLLTGERTLVANAGSQLKSMTYDYTSGVAYGVRSDSEGSLATLDIATGTTTKIGAFTDGGDKIFILALACGLDGTLYGVSTNDHFYKIDKATGACSLIGALGVNAAFDQSMAFDYNNHVLYWANNSDYTLYTIDLTTGKATKIGTIGENGDDSVMSMFVPFINVAAGAPDRVTNRAATTSGKTVTLKWHNPAVDAQGNNLTELQGAKIYRDDELLRTVELTVSDMGKESTITDTGVADGMHSYKIVAFNSKGDGGCDTDDMEVYIGKNAPGAVKGFNVVAGDNTAELSWGAPTEGLHGGEYDPASITKYVISRYDGNTSVDIEAEASATSYVDTPGFGKFTYSICAVNEVGNGATTTARQVLVKPADWLVMRTTEEKVESGKTYKFYDASGPNGYYPNSENDTLVVRPKNQNAFVKAEFKNFYLDIYGDTLYVFNGSSVKAPLYGKFSAETVPGELANLESTAADGALTFVFVSDVLGSYDGWEADVTAVDKKAYDLEALKLSGYQYPEVGSSVEYQFAVRNKGINAVAAADYKVRLVDASGNVVSECDGKDINPMETADFIFGFNAKEAGTLNLCAEIAYDSDLDTGNNKSEQLQVTVLAEGSKYVEIGSNTESIVVAPASFMNAESLAETIYYKEEIGLEKGKLQMVAYSLTKAQGYTTVPIKVWVGETGKTELADGAVPSGELSLVFDGNCPVVNGSSEWSIPFQTPYDYKGGNLVVLVHKDAPGAASDGVEFQGTFGKSGDLKRTRFKTVYGGGASLDPNTTDFGFGSIIWPNTKLLFTASDDGGIADSTSDLQLRIYPNPVTEIMHVDGGAVMVEVFNFTGAKVISAENTATINMAALPEGIYVVKATLADGSTETAKVVKR